MRVMRYRFSLALALKLLFQRGELGKRRIRIDRPFARRTRREVALTPLMSALVAMTIMAVAATALVVLATLLVGRFRRSAFSWRRCNRSLGRALCRRGSTNIRPRPIAVTASSPAMFFVRTFRLAAGLARRITRLRLGGRLLSVMAMPLMVADADPRTARRHARLRPAQATAATVGSAVAAGALSAAATSAASAATGGSAPAGVSADRRINDRLRRGGDRYFLMIIHA